MVDCELIAMLTAVACGITKCFSTDEISLLAASFTQLGDTLATHLVQVELAEKRAEELKRKAEEERRIVDQNKNKWNNNCKDADQ